MALVTYCKLLPEQAFHAQSSRYPRISLVKVSRTDVSCFLCPIPFFDSLFFKLLLCMSHRVRVRWLLLREQLLSNCKRASVDACVFSCIFSPWFGMGASGVMAGVFFGRDGTLWIADIIALLPVEF